MRWEQNIKKTLFFLFSLLVPWEDYGFFRVGREFFPNFPPLPVGKSSRGLAPLPNAFFNSLSSPFFFLFYSSSRGNDL